VRQACKQPKIDTEKECTLFTCFLLFPHLASIRSNGEEQIVVEPSCQRHQANEPVRFRKKPPTARSWSCDIWLHKQYNCRVSLAATFRYILLISLNHDSLLTYVFAKLSYTFGLNALFVFFSCEGADTPCLPKNSNLLGNPPT
jgi:hypothetical protein